MARCAILNYNYQNAGGQEDMKRKLLIATALFFVCAVAIVLIAGHTFEPRASVPVYSQYSQRYAQRAVPHDPSALLRLKRFFSQFAP